MTSQGRAQLGTRSPLFVDIARRALERGQHARAACTLLEGMRRKPQLLVAHLDELTGLLVASIPGPGLEEEIIAVGLVDPTASFCRALVDRLRAQQREAVARAIEVAWERVATSVVARQPGIERGATDPIGLAVGPGEDAGPGPQLQQRGHGTPASLAGPPGQGAPSAEARQAPQRSYVPEPAAAPPEPVRETPVQARPDNPRLRHATGTDWVRRWTPSAPPRSQARSAGHRGKRPTANSRTKSRQLDAWLEARLSASPRGASKAAAPTDGSAERPQGLSLCSSSSMDDLLSRAAATVERAETPLRDRVDGRTSLPWRRIGVTLLVVSCASAAFASIAWESLTWSWEHSDTQRAAAAMRHVVPSELQTAREVALTAAAASDERQAAIGLAVLADRVLATRYGQKACTMPELPVVNGVDVETANALEWLAAGNLEAARALLARADSAVVEDPGAQAWVTGLLAQAEGRTAAAAEALQRATQSYRFELLPLLDLAELALSSRHPEAVARFLAEAQPRRSRHAFLGLAIDLLSHEPSEGVGTRPIVVPPATLSQTQRGWLYFALARQQSARGAAQDALQTALSGLEAAPGNAELQLLAGLLAARAADFVAAETHLGAALSALAPVRVRQARATAFAVLRAAGRPDLVGQIASHDGIEQVAPDELSAVVDALMAAGALERAQALLDAVPHGETPTLLWRALRLAERRGDAEKAATLGASLARQPSVEAHLAHLSRAVQAARFEEAMEEANRIASAYPTELDATLIRADLLSLAGRGDDAAILVETALASETVEVRRTILAALFRSRVGTLRDAERAAALAPAVTDVELLAAQGEIAWRAGNEPAATAAVTKALAADATYARARGLRGMMMPRDAARSRLAWLEGGVEGHRTLPGLMLELAASYRRLGQASDAVAVYKVAIQRPTDHEAAAHGLAQLFRERGELRTGQRRMQDLLEATPSTAATRELRGYLSYWLAMLHGPEQGSYASAKYLQQARLLLGEDVRILEQLARYYEARGYRKVADKFHAQVEEIETGYAP